MAIGALIAGLLAILFGVLLGWIPIFGTFLGLVAGIAGIGLGIAGRNRARQNPAVGGGGMATTGLVTGIVGAVAAILWLIVILVVFDRATTELTELEDFFEELEQLESPGG